jgi:hypothetical protein
VRIGLGATSLRAAAWPPGALRVADVGLLTRHLLDRPGVDEHQSKASSSTAHTGFQEPPVASIATCLTPSHFRRRRTAPSTAGQAPTETSPVPVRRPVARCVVHPRGVESLARDARGTDGRGEPRHQPIGMLATIARLIDEGLAVIVKHDARCGAPASPLPGNGCRSASSASLAGRSVAPVPAVAVRRAARAAPGRSLPVPAVVVRRGRPSPPDARLRSRSRSMSTSGSALGDGCGRAACLESGLSRLRRWPQTTQQSTDHRGAVGGAATGSADDAGPPPAPSVAPRGGRQISRVRVRQAPAAHAPAAQARTTTIAVARPMSMT